jgi:malate synthase
MANLLSSRRKPMANSLEVGGLKVKEELHGLVQDEIAPGTGVEAESFWISLNSIVRDLAPKNRQLLNKRKHLQQQIDAWCAARCGQPFNVEEYTAFLTEIGYLEPECGDFQVSTANVDREIAAVSGPQLVVPLDNARYALNATNARWGSLYDALYGTDVIAEDDGAEKGEGYNPRRGAKVIARTQAFLDQTVALDYGKFSDVEEFWLQESGGKQRLVAKLRGDRVAGLAQPDKFVGYISKESGLASIFLRNNELHIEIQIDRSHPIGKLDSAGVKDVVLEAAVTTIQDCEDSVAAVDAADKVKIYRNWNGIMKGGLEATFERSSREICRRLNADKAFTAPDGQSVTLPGRSLLLVRNVGIHMYTDAVTTTDGREIPEGFLDAMVTSLAALHDLRGNGKHTNSRTGSVYIVKPKMHGTEEVAATIELFERVEDALRLKRNTLKIGIMDEERRTTVNLKNAIRAARERIVFINTGFLDRTGDEIHTSMELGPMLPKMEIKNQPWLNAYENQNVDVGIKTGLVGRAQIGKGMWTMPEEMRKMVETKMAHPEAGANTAWVPSPTAATLHALHYHQLNVAQKQAELASRKRARIEEILTAPIVKRILTPEEVQNELDNNAQGILGYVVRWVDQGIGCSKVPDINNTGLMEDRATLRISSQHMANWLHHGVVTEQQIRETFERMAEVVDRQNKADPNYARMAPRRDTNVAFQAALDLVLQGRNAENGYTEPVLHTRRRQAKRLAHKRPS